MVKIKVPVVSEEKESRKKIIPPVVIITLVILSSMIGVFYFHSEYNTKDVSNIYDENWFRENNQAQIPKDVIDLLQNLSDLIGKSDLVENNPELELPQDIFSSIFPNKTVFYVKGRVEPLAWKVAALSDYVPNSGWKFKPVDFTEINTSPSGTYDYNYTVVKAGVVVNTSTELFVPTLLAGPEEIAFQDPYIEEVIYPTPPPPSLSMSYIREKDLNSGGGALRLQSNVGVNISLSYMVYGISLNETWVSSSSGAVSVTRNLASGDDYLSRFIELPRNYMREHPSVENLAKKLYLGQATVYQQVKNVISYLSINFEIKNESAPSDEDPVAWFVNNGGGTPIYFLYTAAVILRYYGLPTRIAVGYIIGDYKPEIDMTEFTMSRHLFLWLEVYDSGLNSWVNYNAIPYIFTGITGIPLPENLIDLTIVPIVNIIAPRYVDGLPSVYINESFSVICVIVGISDPDVFGYMTVYDLNISTTTSIGNSPFTQDNNSIVALFGTSFQILYASIGETPVYGVHILKIVVGSLIFYRAIALLRRVSISP